MKKHTVKLIYLLTIMLVFASCSSDNISNVSIKTLDISTFDSNSATCGGTIASDNSLIVSKVGICWSLKANPTLSDSYTLDSIGAGEFTVKIKNLNADSTYYVRTYYINNQDTVYGNQVSFKTTNVILFNPSITYGSVTDIDNNIYKTVTIGTKTWMAENLKTTHYQNGDIIANETDLSKWGYFQLKTGAYCWYNNNTKYKEIYGALYNWYAASDNRNIAPAGWHVATSADWETLRMYVNQRGGGYILREATSAHWKNVKELSEIANSTGFTALPAGKIATLPYGFMDIGGSYSYFWTSTGTLDGSSCVYINSELSIANLQPNCLGFSIRCVKD